MSSVIIKGMDYPKSCDECQLLEGDWMDGLCRGANRWLDDDDWLWRVTEDGTIVDDKPVNCPLVEIPSPHGKIIDADAEIKRYGLDKATKYGNDTWDEIDFSYSTMMMYEIAGLFENAPTILDAEGEDE